MKEATKHEAERLGAEKLYRVRRYLIDNYYEQYGGWVCEVAEASYKLLGIHIRTCGLTVH